MLTVNNIKQIVELLKFNSDDDFYHLQIIKRKKENPEIGSNNYVVRSYCIRSKEQLLHKGNEIGNMCLDHNARAYINLNVRSFEKMAFHTLKKVADQIMNKDYASVRTAFESVCGMYGTGGDKSWVVDVDLPQVDPTMLAFINTCDPIGDDKIIAKIQTRNGWHVITKPFNMATFATKYPEIEVHKNNPTILMAP
jgi:hypothetical protein